MEKYTPSEEFKNALLSEYRRVKEAIVESKNLERKENALRLLIIAFGWEFPKDE